MKKQVELSSQEILQNWQKLLKLIEITFQGERQDKMLKMYNDLEDLMVTAPASSFEHFHNAFPGGYVDHVLRVAVCAKKVSNLWETSGTNIDYTEEELLFVAINHDLGKIGDGQHENYLPETSDWHRKNMGRLYQINSEVPFMLIQDRSLFLLQKYQVPMSMTEYLGIKLHDGLYDDVNKPYLIASRPDTALRTHLPLVIHQADILAAKIELDRWHNLNKK